MPCSERFNEENLLKARNANRLLQEGGDARLEALFGDGPEQTEEIPQVLAWEAGAEEVAKMIGAEVDYLTQKGPITPRKYISRICFWSMFFFNTMWRFTLGKWQYRRLCRLIRPT